MPKPAILFRADGNSQIGLGHVVRSLALAEMLQPYFQCLFAIREPSAATAQQIKESGCEVIALPTTPDYLTEAEQLVKEFAGSTPAVVLDGYQFSTQYQQAIRKYMKLVCLDDIHACHFVADVLINPAGGIDENVYSKEAYTKIYTGPAYALLRSPFLTATRHERPLANTGYIFLNMGGADPENHTLRLLEELVPNPAISGIEVVAGNAYAYAAALKTFVEAYPKVKVHVQLTAEAMCGLMQTCQAAILPPSSVAYEWCSVGGPLFLLRTAANQTNLEQFLVQNQLAFPFTDFNRIFPGIQAGSPVMQQQIQRQRTYFDGQSPGRLRKIFYRLIYPDLLFLRAAGPDDRMLLYDWINEPAVRQFSLNPAPVPLGMHLNWYQHKLSDKNCFIFIAEILAEPIGMIRFDISNDEAVISYLLDKDYRGKGLGVRLLQKGIQKLKAATTRFSVISGLVQKHNTASIRAFEKAGFTAVLLTDSQHPNILKFTLPRPNNG